LFADEGRIEGHGGLLGADYIASPPVYSILLPEILWISGTLVPFILPQCNPVRGGTPHRGGDKPPPVASADRGAEGGVLDLLTVPTFTRRNRFQLYFVS
jgi:hypothetical protein